MRDSELALIDAAKELWAATEDWIRANRTLNLWADSPRMDATDLLLSIMLARGNERLLKARAALQQAYDAIGTEEGQNDHSG